MFVAVASLSGCGKDVEEISADINTGISSGVSSGSHSAVLKITCNSSAPYTITITNTSTGDSRDYVLQGHETQSYTVACGVNYDIAYSQNSGYIFYPTTGTKHQYADCGSTYTISIPR